MKNQSIFWIVLLIINIYSTAFAERKEVVVEENDLVVNQITATELSRYENLFGEVSPDKISPLIALQLVRKEKQEYEISEDMTRITMGFPIKAWWKTTNVVFSDSKLKKIVSDKIQSDWVLTTSMLIMPFICIFLFTQLFFIQTNKKSIYYLILFYIALITGVLVGATIGELAGAFAGMFAGMCTGAFAGMFAGGLAGMFAGMCTGAFAGMFAGGLAGEFAGEFGWHNADINSYIIILIIMCVFSYVVGNLLKFIINKKASKEIIEE